MLYKFKSEAGGDVIMLEATGKQLLVMMGKGADAQGILLPEQMAQAKTALEAGIAHEEQAQAQLAQEAGSASAQASPQGVSLRTRAWPLVTLIERSLKAQVPIVWGV